MNRLGFLGASDFSALLGLSKWKTPKQLWLEKTGQAEPQPRSLRLDVGLALEPLIAARFERFSGLRTRIESPLTHPSEPWLRAAPDGYAVDPLVGLVGFVEYKTCAFAKRDDGWGKPGTSEIPAGYFAQVQVQMLVARACGLGVVKTFVPCLLLNRLGDESNPQVFEVPWDAEMAGGLLERGREFWRHVEMRAWPFDESEAA